MIKKIGILAAPALLSAILLRLSFPKPSLYPLAFIGFFPLFAALMKMERPRDGLFIGFIFGFIFYYSNIFWLNTLAYYNKFIYIGILLLGIYLGLFGALFGWLAVLLKKRVSKTALFFYPSLWVAIEYLRNIGQLSFPWSYISASQAANLPFIQICSITGIWGVSFLLALANTALAIAFLRIKERRKFSEIISAPLWIAAVIALNHIYGITRLYSKNEPTHPPLRAALIQTDIPQKIKYAGYAGTEDDTKNIPPQLESVNFEMLSKIETRGADLVLFPESAVISPYFAYQKELLNKLSKEAKRISAPILIGANREVFFDEQGRIVGPNDKIFAVNAYNSAWFIKKDGSLFQQSYDKIHLVPFGEHLPYFDLIPGFQRIIVQTGSFLKGVNYTLFPVESEGHQYHFGAVICFESSFGWLFRKFTNRGADFLAIMTNDGWYENSAGPFQHADLSIFRAIETGRYVLRCSNRGPSWIIKPNGQIAKTTSLNERCILTGTIYPMKNKTIYAAIGDWLALPYFILPMLACYNHFKKRGKIKK
ncbi:MAG TPA: apolipoprotein N-acyltransferase [Candidatus Sumerlaeota bacterium]|nr:apolipoprotein N-acyltransferase [Candidatus Sumerlaeota bacterium]HON49848.1 apolipoprotein N-acyltransferase [Candidatus Sumerlaeota bacterium]HOR63904.1 apolipoprotein N-acyltransferase [Candidatus Sumerlaeota bacterium]HPL75052.1 apolipoprotein N-acyltransferase [Candidatus Sumerlaeota bacterium]HRU54526.1 apolipoprotein N-acyltransferase [Candidatus Sumerlaeia bacterium]